VTPVTDRPSFQGEFVASSKRERQLARERHERAQQKAVEQAEQRRRRQRIIAVVLAVAAAVALIWLLVSLAGGDDTATPPAASPTPTTEPSGSPSTSPAALDCTDAPPAREAKQLPDGPIDLQIDPARGTWGWYLDTNCTVSRDDPNAPGTKKDSNRITIAFDPAKAPQTVNSLLFLSDRNQWYDNSSCHRLTTDGIFVLQCGDPTLTGTGGPGYQIPDENLPTGGGVTYPRGTVAMANSGPNTNGSQFFIVYADTTLPPNYSVVGTVTEGLDIVDAIAAAGVEGGATDGRPAQPIGFSKVVGYITQEVAQ
jgi:peptidyl-prolyl cis-trans isomerase B (cyclophilin B)